MSKIKGLYLIYCERDSGVASYRIWKLDCTAGFLDKRLQKEFGESFVIKNMVKL